MYIERNKELPKEYTQYLGASDIVNSAGGSYIIKEPEMESALREIMAEIDGQ
jgi:hypothetical protein